MTVETAPRGDTPALDRHQLEIIGADECWELLGSRPIGRVAIVDGGEPLVLPVTHVTLGQSVLFRTVSGSKMSAAIMQRPCAYEVDDWDADTLTGWSVLVRGVADVADEADLPEGVALPTPWADFDEPTLLVRIRADEISGRRITHD